MRSDPFGTGTKLVQVSIEFIRDLADLLQISPPVRYQMGSLVKTVSFQDGTETV